MSMIKKVKRFTEFCDPIMTTSVAQATAAGVTYRKDRGWGYELWLANSPQYCGKILHVEQGKRGSLHYHIDKEETMHLDFGEVDLRMIDHQTGTEYTIHLFPGDTITIPRGQAHQIIAIEESEIIEFSTEHFEDDSYRIQKGD